MAKNVESRPPHPGDEGGQVKETDEARQAVTGHGARYVLGFGLAGIVTAFAILLIYYWVTTGS